MFKISTAAVIQTIPILFIFVIMGYVYYVYVVLYCTKFLIYIENSRVEGGLYIAFSNLLLILFLISYFTVMFKSPGYTTDFTLRREGTPITPSSPLNPGNVNGGSNGNNKDQEMNQENVVMLRESEINPFKSYCGICFGSLRPLRAHHCVACDKCILKMDHHCVWFYQCVGFRNYKAFMLTLTYGLILCLFMFITILVNIGDSNQREWHITIQMIVASFMIFVFAIAILVLLAYHIYLLLNNMTTIEHREKREYPNPIEWKNPYDLGWKRNFTQVHDGIYYSCILIIIIL